MQIVKKPLKKFYELATTDLTPLPEFKLSAKSMKAKQERVQQMIDKKKAYSKQLEDLARSRNLNQYQTHKAVMKSFESTFSWKFVPPKEDDGLLI